MICVIIWAISYGQYDITGYIDVGDGWMLVTLCWWRNFDIYDIFLMLVLNANVERKRMSVSNTAKNVTNMSKLPPTNFASKFRHQHRCSRYEPKNTRYQHHKWCWFWITTITAFEIYFEFHCWNLTNEIDEIIVWCSFLISEDQKSFNLRNFSFFVIPSVTSDEI